MTARSETDDYRALFLTPTPMIDLRSPAEFARGAFPTAASLPLLTDEERAQVGICYKQQGQGAAIALGHELVSGDLKESRLAAWLQFAREHPEGCLYCWRGGLRSQTVQQWFFEAGVEYTRVTGGYKAMRRFLIDELERSLPRVNLVLVGGKTGTGKTRVIERLLRCIDLEGLANHRGSTFGQMPVPQPAQIDFENAISIELLRLQARSQGPVFVEDEGRLVGRLALPEILRTRMAASPLCVVEETIDSRVQVVLEDYVIDLGQRYALLFGEDGAARHAEKMQSDLTRIRKRLGGDRFQQVSAAMERAFEEQWRSGDTSAHREWIGFLLRNYYDPMYEYQLQQRDGEILFAGPRSAVLAWAKEYSADG